MRILIYSEAFHPSAGGIETFTSTVAGHLAREGVHVVVATETPSDRAEPFPYRVARRPGGGDWDELVARADLVQMNAFHVPLLLRALRRRRKIVCTYHDLTMICPKGTKWKVDGPCLHPAGPRVCTLCLRASGEPVVRRLSRPVLKAVLSRCIHANVCTSPFGMERFALWRKRLILNGIDTSVFVPGAGSMPPAVPDRDRSEPPSVVLVTRLIPEKGAALLLEAQRICADAGFRFRTDICGQGPELPRLRALAAEHGLREAVTFHGVVGGPPLVAIMQRATAAVVPSLIDEPFGIAAIEAMSCGLPVIAADVGGLGRIVGEAGFTFPRGDTGALAARLQQVLGDPALRRAVGARAREVAVRKYDMKVMAGSYLALYRELLTADV